MGLELELEVEDEAAIFSASIIRGRLTAHDRAVPAFRETLNWGRDRLYALFQEGTPADSLVRARAFLVDEVLREAWQRFLPGQPEGLALVAVGGYGRGELLPHSDIDLLLLHDGGLDALKPQLEPFMAFLWDIGLEVGSSVRTVNECQALARGDITIMTTLVESRLLAGDGTQFVRMQSALAPERVWPVKDFFKAKVDEQKKRHLKYDDTGYKLEPNVKEGPGGLRDIHTIAWVAKRHFGAQTLAELKDQGFLTAQECTELFAGQDFLWRVRFALHMLNGRKEDRLLFDHQVRVARLFGYVDNEQSGNRAVEQFMQLYYRTIKSLSCLNDLLLQLFDEAILRPVTKDKAQPLNARFQVRGGCLEARSPDVFRRSPYALIEIFLLLQKHADIDGIRAETLRLLRRDRRLVDEGLRDDVRARALFLEMFRVGTGLTRALRRMNRYGVLGRYLPVFGTIIGHMQFDLFHTLTVDEHTLYVLRNLRRMALERFRQELPFCNQVMQRIDKKELLYLAALFHDLAKGRGGDHSELGAEDAEHFCLDHGISHADAELVSWLVRNHLLMSLTAQRMDISDPEVVAQFAGKVGDRGHLDYLFLLTCADIRGTNPALWNSWRESLLTDLYNATARALERGLHDPVRQDEIVGERRARTLPLLAAHGMDAAGAQAIWQRFENDYFMRHSPEELAWHVGEIARAREDQLPLILVRPLAERGTTVFLYMRDRDHLFGLTTGVLAQLGLNILDARINTTADGYTLDSYVLMEGDGAPIQPGHRFEEIGQALRKVLADPNTSVIHVTRKMPARLKHFHTPTTVFFTQDRQRNRTVMQLVTGDRPGLLSLIGRVFEKRGILLDAAKINTVGERAEDAFFVTDKQRRPLEDEKLLSELREVLTRTLHRGEFVAEEFRLTAVA
ncbi:MAG TPA: [protein-PII] uridylyltransferase [Candidatus Binatia bacterium]|nr:[protein-PII] uridylyltransferase [Candidatus Binatia bacterium]